MTTTTYAADRTALLIVDPYNDFMSEGGKLYEATRETAEAVGFYDNMRKLIPAIRAARIQVFIVPHHRWREGDYKGWKHMNPSQVRGNQIQGFAAGTWGGEFHPEFGPRDGDVVVLEHWAQSGFANTDLDAQLTQRGIEKIYLLAELTVWPGFVEEVKAILKEALIPTLGEPGRPPVWRGRRPGA